MPCFRKTFFLLFLLGCWTGCSLGMPKAALEKKKAEIELKKKNYTALLADIRNHALTKGIPAATIQETYGKPDDIFHSGSIDSSFDIWTYEKVLSKEEAVGQPIRLYFDNGKLVNWNY